jgi:hypothetical protein
MQRSEAQREASRINGAKSRGPTSPEGKAVSKFNGLKHGLRAEQIVLPGEDPAEFEAERKGWMDDWKPQSHTRAVLVERAAIVSWRLRRSVRVEAARLRELADAAAHGFDDERFARVERVVERLPDDPPSALALLESHAAGIDRLITAWRSLAAALAGGPGGWDQPLYHSRLMYLLGHRGDADPADAGPMPLASARLLAANAPGNGIDRLPADRRAEAVEGLRGLIAEQLGRLEGLRREVPDPAVLRRRAIDAALAEVSEAEELRHRYEMAHDRSLRATIGQLMALERSGADLAGSESEPEEKSGDASDDPAPSEGAEAGAPGSVGAGDLGTIPTRGEAPSRGVRGPISVPEPAGGGGSPR